MRTKALSFIAAGLLAIAAIPAHAAFAVKTAATETTVATTNSCTDMNAVSASTASFDAIAAAAKSELKSLSHAERKARIHAVKDQIKAWKAGGNHSDVNLLLYVILAILIPPLAVGLYDHGLSTRFWIDLILTLLFYLPGLIYALIVILG